MYIRKVGHVLISIMCHYNTVGHVSIDFNLKVGIIFIKENFFEGGLIAIHHPRFFFMVCPSSY